MCIHFSVLWNTAKVESTREIMLKEWYLIKQIFSPIYSFFLFLLSFSQTKIQYWKGRTCAQEKMIIVSVSRQEVLEFDYIILPSHHPGYCSWLYDITIFCAQFSQNKKIILESSLSEVLFFAIYVVILRFFLKKRQRRRAKSTCEMKWKGEKNVPFNANLRE